MSFTVNNRAGRRILVALLAAAGFAAGIWTGVAGTHPAAACHQQDLSPVPDTVFAQQETALSAPPEKWVCLTFDDGPSKTTPAVLDALKNAGVPATFFVVATGYNDKYLPLVSQAQASGHQIALHSASHEYDQTTAARKATGRTWSCCASACPLIWMHPTCGICVFPAEAPTPSAVATAAKG